MYLLESLKSWRLQIVQISYERLYFQASSRPHFKRLHEGFKNVRSAYESHISRPQPHSLKTAATWLSMTPRFCLREGGSRAGPEEVQGGFRGHLQGSKKNTRTHKNRVPSPLRSYNQHSVQQVPVGQNGSRYPLGAGHEPTPPHKGSRRLNLPTLSNTPPKRRRIL